MAELTNYEYALKLIESYIGKPLSEQTAVEPMVRLNKRGVGTLKNHPVLSVTEIKGISRQAQFGFSSGMSETTIEPACLYLIDEYGHFIMNTDNSIAVQIWGLPDFYRITYKYGLATIPDDIVKVARIIEANILRKEELGGFSGIKQISTLDFNVALFDDKLISSNELAILNKYRGV